MQNKWTLFKGGNAARADVIEVAGDAERFGRLLSAALCRVAPPGEEDGKDSKQEERQASPSQERQRLSSR
jgi:hypothetical protein